MKKKKIPRSKLIPVPTSSSSFFPMLLTYVITFTSPYIRYVRTVHAKGFFNSALRKQFHFHFHLNHQCAKHQPNEDRHRPNPSRARNYPRIRTPRCRSGRSCRDSNGRRAGLLPNTSRWLLGLRWIDENR